MSNGVKTLPGDDLKQARGSLSSGQPPQKKTNASGETTQVDAAVRTLVVPAVAVGNVGQIAVDLLCKLGDLPVEVIDSEGLLMPCVGNAGKQSKRRISTSLELHTFSTQVSLLHISSMVVPGRSRLFSRLVLQLAKTRGFQRILVVGAASALALINDDQLSRTRHVPRLYNLPLDDGFLQLEYEVSELKLAGLLPFFIQESAETGVNVGAIVSFVFEGENWSDGVEMCKATMKVLAIQPE